jgi:hypothetical protein
LRDKKPPANRVYTGGRDFRAPHLEDKAEVMMRSPIKRIPQGVPRSPCRRLLAAGMAIVALTVVSSQAATVAVPLELTSPLPAGIIPMDVEMDFAKLLADAKQPGVFDPNTVEVISP